MIERASAIQAGALFRWETIGGHRGVTCYPKKEWTFKRENPSLRQVLGSVSAVQIARYSLDTLEVVRNAYEKWTAEYTADGHPVSFHFIEVNFAWVENEDDRSKLYEIGTTFSLSDDEVDLLISSARQALRFSSNFQDFFPG